MSFYLLKETIQPCAKPAILGNKSAQFVAVLTTPEWERERESFDMGIDLDLDTVITTIFMPLTLIAGWYGMNFRYMPELEWRYGYLAVFVLSAAVIICCLILFKRKKWL